MVPSQITVKSNPKPVSGTPGAKTGYQRELVDRDLEGRERNGHETNRQVQPEFRAQTIADVLPATKRARPPVPKPGISLETIAANNAALENPVAKFHSNTISNTISNATTDRSKPSAGKNQLPVVVVVVDTSTERGRRLVKGINSFAVKHGPWNLWIQPSGIPGSTSDASALGGDGLIAEFENSDEVSHALACGRPAVNVAPVVPGAKGIPSIISNEVRVAELAIEHFHERGLQEFAYVGPLKSEPCIRHASAFQGQLRDSGIECELFDCDSEQIIPAGWAVRSSQMHSWLGRLKKPLGVFTFGTGSAMQVMNVCRENGISVPDHISVLSGNDDELLCTSMTPSLSGIRTASEQIGYEAARQLHEMMTGKQLPAETSLIDPVLISSRQSTESIAISDPDLLAAVRFIRDNACGGINVQEVADSVPIGRRSLERKFKEHFGRTPLDEIQRLRLGRVCELLIKTDLPVSQIAADAGFGTPEYMTTMFKSRFGLTPLKFRSQTRAR